MKIIEMENKVVVARAKGSWRGRKMAAIIIKEEHEGILVVELFCVLRVVRITCMYTCVHAS